MWAPLGSCGAWGSGLRRIARPPTVGPRGGLYCSSYHAIKAGGGAAAEPTRAWHSALELSWLHFNETLSLRGPNRSNRPRLATAILR